VFKSCPRGYSQHEPLPQQEVQSSPQHAVQSTWHIEQSQQATSSAGAALTDRPPIANNAAQAIAKNF
jgi:hypothetical protein